MPTPTAREETRRRVVAAAADLLARYGRDAVTTRSVADAAGVQAPAIYRLFGDKDGLLEAVALDGFARFMAAKHADPDPADPIEALRAGWDLAVEFGVANPALYALMYGEPTKAVSAAAQAGLDALAQRVHGLAGAGWLRLDEDVAVQVIHATARGAVLTWLAVPEASRKPALLTALREAMIAAVTYREPAVPERGPAPAARALRAALPDQTTLTDGERQLLTEWLDRLAAEG